MTDDRLRDLYISGTDARRGAAAGRGCDVEPEALLALARGDLPPDERPALFDRVMANAACREEFALLRAIVVAERGAPAVTGAGDAGGPHDPVAAPDAGGPVGDPPRAPAEVVPLHAAPSLRARRRRWAAIAAPLAAAAALAVVIGVPAMRQDAAGPVMRGAADGVELVAPASDPVSPTAARTFVWRPAPEAARYAFELLDADGALLHDGVTADTTLALPAAVRLTPGAEYRWLVRAADAGGDVRGTAVGRLRIAGP